MERFGDLLLLERLAAGGMAEVFRAKQLGYAGFEKTVAIKRILPHFASSDDFKQMFRAEANLSAMLQHPNITQIFSNGENEGYLYLVMEFVDGKNLRQLLARADKVKLRIPLEISCFMISEALKGLDYAHHFLDERTGEALGIVHRDISPQNLMLGYEGSVKVVDFGIAKVASKAESTRAGVLKGKFGYMSPEQARGATLDKRSDVFSMGIILWELITQRRLFTYEDELKTLEKVRECKVPRPSEKNPSIPYSLEKIVMRALEKEPSNRYSSAAEFYGDLARYVNDRHPNFIPTDFSKFMKQFYKEEIAEEKKRREKLNLEAPSFMAEAGPVKKSKSAKKKAGTVTGTPMPQEEITLVSDIGVPGIDTTKTRRDNPDIPVAVTTLNLPKDSNEVAQSASDIMMIGLQKEAYPAQKSISRIGLAESTGRIQAAQPKPYVIPQNRSGTVMAKRMRGAAFFLLLAMGTYGALSFIPSKSAVEVVTDKTSKDVKSKKQKLAEPVVEEVATQAPVEEGRNPAAVDLGSVFVWNPSRYETFGSINLTGTPNADKIFINGKRLVDVNNVPLTTPIPNLKLEPGHYKLELQNSVFNKTQQIDVDVVKDKRQSVEARFDKG